MNLFIFILYYLLCTFVLIILSLFIVRFIVKKDCNIISRIAQKQIDDYFKAYDNGNFLDSFDDSQFVNDIHILDEDSNNSSQSNNKTTELHDNFF